ncbi:MAG TPA: hypothetical protein PKD64_18295 [Pirellulaceae bacterium]|nr:hypothetical protein [Pirellulaceae bacterium]HMO94140.1 hypothetical protein [Pirellulaceae bacterium]HMP71211.1 hypothetical protein [Pirellulaceae bacterium]
MSIFVECPNGCLITLTNNQRGKFAECTSCRSIIRVPRTGESRLIDGHRRTVYKAGWIASHEEAAEIKKEPNTQEPISLLSQDAKNNALYVIESLGVKQDERQVETLDDVLPFLIDRTSLPIEQTDQVVIEIAELDHDNHDRDRVWLTRFYASCLVVTAIVNCVPILVYMTAFAPQSWETTLPRWSFALIFTSLLLISYAVYLWQLADWSSLLVSACIALFASCCFGFIAAGLWLGTVNNTIAGYLQLPQSYYYFGPIWGGIMFGLLALTSFALGRDALYWQRNIGF